MENFRKIDGYICVKYYRDATPLETSWAEPIPEQKQLIPQTTPLPTPRIKKTSPDQTMDGMPSNRRNQDVREQILDRDKLKKSPHHAHGH